MGTGQTKRCWPRRPMEEKTMAGRLGFGPAEKFWCSGPASQARPLVVRRGARQFLAPRRGKFLIFSDGSLITALITSRHILLRLGPSTFTLICHWALVVPFRSSSAVSYSRPRPCSIRFEFYFFPRFSFLTLFHTKPESKMALSDADVQKQVSIG